MFNGKADMHADVVSYVRVGNQVQEDRPANVAEGNHAQPVVAYRVLLDNFARCGKTHNYTFIGEASQTSN